MERSLKLLSAMKIAFVDAEGTLLAEGYMDDEIREAIHAKLAPCDDLTFLAAYLEAHYEKYGEMLEI